MAPDRGSPIPHAGQPLKYQAINAEDSDQEHDPAESAIVDDNENGDEDTANAHEARRRSDARDFLAEQADQGQNFTVRGVLVGLAIGVIICFSNTYFGLQTGWVSGMAMPAALIGFAYFKAIARYIDYPFTPVENVLVQTVAGAVGTMPLGCGFVGVLPALNHMLKPEENGPINLGTWKLIVWSVGICFFGVVFAVPLRKEVIIREKLKFPSGTATALMIGVLHGNTDNKGNVVHASGLETLQSRGQDRPRSSVEGIPPGVRNQAAPMDSSGAGEVNEQGLGIDHRSNWKAKIRLLVMAFGISAVYTLISYFVPQFRDLPIFGLPLATQWLWTLNPSPAYVGQGIIMGPATTLHMLLGAILGWGVLSPLAKSKGWAPGKVENWETGSKGWIVWVSLAVMLADSVISLGWLTLRPLMKNTPRYYREISEHVKKGIIRDVFRPAKGGYTALSPSGHSTPLTHVVSNSSVHHNYFPSSSESPPDDTPSPVDVDAPEPDAPPHHLVPIRHLVPLFIFSLILCVVSIRLAFGPLIPYHAIILALLLSLLLSLMGVRALGETDLNPVSGISKLTQLFFALVIPSTNKNAVAINLIAGAVSESGALQAGDMMQDLKTGHLLGAAPRAQFWGQMIGSFFGAVVSAGVYKLYTSVYEVPGGMFQVPTGFVWIFTARLVTGKGLPAMAWQSALVAGLLFCGLTAFRIRGRGTWWVDWVPGGIAVAVGMYNVPSFTLARAVGGMVNWYWRVWRKREDTPVVVLASGLILGEGVVSIVNLGLASLGVPHL